MDTRSIVLLTDQAFFEALSTVLKTTDTVPEIIQAATLDQLRHACGTTKGDKRLIAFCTDVIVPADLLKSFSYGAYNFHPGPPDYPGIFPSCFAIYNQSDQFGVTAHRMTETVDGGDIVGTERFDIEPNIDRLTLDSQTYQAIIRLFGRLAPRLTNLRDELPITGEKWSGTPTTKKDFEKLCEISADITESDFQLRYRAIGEGPNHALNLSMFGHRFRLDNRRNEATVYRGGQATNTS